MPHNLGDARQLVGAALRAVGVPSEAADRLLPKPLGPMLTQPTRFQARLGESFAEWCSACLVRGTLDRRLLLIESAAGGWTAASLDAAPLGEFPWPAWAREHVRIGRPDEPVGGIEFSPADVERLHRPKVLIAALYHPEFFPLPRFPLGISDLARAARGELLGEIELMDMQLGASIGQIAAAARGIDILGISATFGQHDLMTNLLDAVYSFEQPPLVIAGGSLTVRNERALLEAYPRLLIARSAGEQTIADLVCYWHRDLELSHVHGLGYLGAARTSR